MFETMFVSVSLYLFMELEKHNIRVIFCDSKYNPYAELKPYFGCMNMPCTINNQIGWSNFDKDRVWNRVVQDKINNQKTILDIFSFKYPIDTDYNEANFAAIYFKKLFGKDFVRFGNDDVNSLLNYGYTLLLSKVSRILIHHGYLTQLGIHHHNNNNNYNLSCDFIEPFRPIVDKLAYIFRRECFDKKIKKELQSIFVEEQIYIDDKKYTLGDGMDIYINNKIDCLTNNQLAFCELRLK